MSLSDRTVDHLRVEPSCELLANAHLDRLLSQGSDQSNESLDSWAMAPFPVDRRVGRSEPQSVLGSGHRWRFRADEGFPGTPQQLVVFL